VKKKIYDDVSKTINECKNVINSFTIIFWFFSFLFSYFSLFFFWKRENFCQLVAGNGMKFNFFSFYFKRKHFNSNNSFDCLRAVHNWYFWCGTFQTTEIFFWSIFLKIFFQLICGIEKDHSKTSIKDLWRKIFS